MKRVPIHNRRHDIVAYALVDDADFDRVRERTWCLVNGYAQGRADANASRPIFMHRFILGLSPGGKGRAMVDHINGDPLDNRRENLRLVGPSANGQNRHRVTAAATSRHRGVSYRADRKRWRAHAKLDGRFVHVGHFRTEQEAADAAAEFRRVHMPYSKEAAAA